MTKSDYRKLCIRLLVAIDSGNAKAEDHVLCQIRQAVKDEDVTELVKHAAELVEGVTITTKEGGSIKMTGDAVIQMSDGAIKIG